MILVMTLSLASPMRFFRAAIASANLAFRSSADSFDGDPFCAGVGVGNGLRPAPGERRGVWLRALLLRRIEPARMRREKRIFWEANESSQCTLLRVDAPWTRCRREACCRSRLKNLIGKPVCHLYRLVAMHPSSSDRSPTVSGVRRYTGLARRLFC